MIKRGLIALCLMAACSLSAEEEVKKTTARYETQVYKGTLYLIDTTTGALWWLEHNTWGGYRWVKLSVELPED